MDWFGDRSRLIYLNSSSRSGYRWGSGRRGGNNWDDRDDGLGGTGSVATEGARNMDVAIVYIIDMHID